jgi:vancomycin resistance protein VanJ
VRWGAFAAPWLAFSLLPAAGAFILSRRWWTATASLVLAFLILSPALPRLSPTRWSRPPETNGLRVMTFNTSLVNDDIGAISEAIAHERPDIVFLQQIGNLTLLRARLEQLLPNAHFASFPARTNDLAILSRLPLSQAREFNSRSTAIAAAGTCRFRLWNFHAPHGQTDFAAQNAFFSGAAAAIKDDPLPIIAAGDLNSTEFNSVQAPLRAVLTDVYSAVGAGFGFTFPSRVRNLGMFGRLFRIDHILVRGLVSESAWIGGTAANSDHFPVMATFQTEQRCRLNRPRY